MRRLILLSMIILLTAYTVFAVAVAKRITDPSELIGGPAADGKVGDYLLKNEKIAIIIGDRDNYHGYMRSGGNVLDAALSNTSYDLLDEFHTYFSWPKQLIADEIRILSDGRNGGPAIVEVKGHHSHIENVDVVSKYILGPDDDYIKIVTSVTNRTGKDLEKFILGDAAFFGYTRPFVWGLGFKVAKSDTLLLGAQGDGLAYGFSTTELDPETGEMRKIHLAYIFADPEIKTVTIKDGETVTYERLFFVAKDLASIQKEILDLRNEQYILFQGFAFNDDGNSLVNLPVEIYDENGVVYSVAYTDVSGRYLVPLLPGKYSMKIKAEGMETVKAVEVEVVKTPEGLKLECPSRFLVAKYKESNDLLWGPYIVDFDEDYVVIQWKSEIPSSAKVLVSCDGKKITVEDKDVKKLHKVKIEGLKEGSKCEYSVVLNDEFAKGISTAEFTFKTKRKTVPFKFLVYGDTRTYDRRHRYVADLMAEEEADFVVHAGDLVMDGRILDDWNGFFWAIKNLGATTPYYTAHGNHEYNAIYYFEAFDNPRSAGYGKGWYYFTYGNSLFVILNADVLLMQRNMELFKEETEWLENVLENNKDKKFKFVFFHEPFWTNCAEYGEVGESPTAKYWKEIFEKYGVTIVFNSHHHLYERFKVNGLNYITTGGGGAPLYLKLRSEKLPGTEKIVTGIHHYVVVKVDENTVQVEVVGVAKQLNKKKENEYEKIPKTVIDSFTIVK